jgi:hypothetical protein
MEALPFDFDGAISLEALKSKLSEKRFAALLYTTYSHGKTSTTVSVNRYINFAKKHNLRFPPTREAMAIYLEGNGLAHLENIVFDLSRESAAKHIITASETYYLVLHKPVPKLRVILFLDETMPLVGEEGVGVDGYKSIYEKAACELFGPDALQIIDLSCRNPCQPIYLPAKPLGSTADHQILAFDGPLWDWQPVWREVASDLEERRRKIAKRQRAFDDTPRDLKVRQLAQCLKHVPAEDYDVWIRCLLAIFNESEGSDEGLRLAHEWSATNPDKYDEVAVDRKWGSFSETSGASTRVGLGTLVFLARQYFPEFHLDESYSEIDLSLIGF